MAAESKAPASRKRAPAKRHSRNKARDTGNYTPSLLIHDPVAASILTCIPSRPFPPKGNGPGRHIIPPMTPWRSGLLFKGRRGYFDERITECRDLRPPSGRAAKRRGED